MSKSKILLDSFKATPKYLQSGLSHIFSSKNVFVGHPTIHSTLYTTTTDLENMPDMVVVDQNSGELKNAASAMLFKALSSVNLVGSAAEAELQV